MSARRTTQHFEGCYYELFVEKALRHKPVDDQSLTHLRTFSSVIHRDGVHWLLLHGLWSLWFYLGGAGLVSLLNCCCCPEAGSHEQCLQGRAVVEGFRVFCGKPTGMELWERQHRAKVDGARKRTITFFLREGSRRAARLRKVRRPPFSLPGKRRGGQDDEKKTDFGGLRRG
jgi:hypothetical protein